jgi:hypothetical protein
VPLRGLLFDQLKLIVATQGQLFFWIASLPHKNSVLTTTSLIHLKTTQNKNKAKLVAWSFLVGFWTMGGFREQVYR